MLLRASLHYFHFTSSVFCGIFIIASLISVHSINAQCDPSEINLCELGDNNTIQACYHAQIAKTSNGYSITGEDFATNGVDYSTVLRNIPSANYPMPNGIVPLWGAIGGRTQAVFLGTDSKVYAIGEQDLLIDETHTSGPSWGPTNLSLPFGINVCDVSKWQGTAGSGSGNNNNSNVTGDTDGFLVFSTFDGDAYITGDGAEDMQSNASNTAWTKLNLPTGVAVVNFGVGYRTLMILGSDGNLYASGPNTYLGDGTSENLSELTLLANQPPVSIFGISQIEAGWDSYFVLDGDGTIHVLGDNSEGSLGTGDLMDVTTWSKVGQNCSGGILKSVSYISTMSTHDNRLSSSAILVDATIRSWGSNNRQSITTGEDALLPCPILPTGNNRNAVAISNGGHISPYVNTNVQICNIGHNRQGAFGDGNDEQGDYGEYLCRIIPGMPEICGTKEANLSLDKTVSDLSPKTGDEIIFTLTVINLGPEASTGSFVRDILDPAFHYLSDDSNGNYIFTNGLWVVGPLEVGESSSINITVLAIATGNHRNYAQIIVDNEVDVNSVPGNESNNEDDDDLVILNVSPCPIIEVDTLLCPEDSIFLENTWVFEPGFFVEIFPSGQECDTLRLTTVNYVVGPPQPVLDVDCEDGLFYLSVDSDTPWNPTWSNSDETYQTTYESGSDLATVTLETAPNCIEEFEVDLPPLPDLSVIPQFLDTTVLENTFLELFTSIDTSDWSMNWIPNSIFDCVDCPTASLSTDESTLVTLELEHISGCLFESTFFLTIEKEPEFIFAPNVFVPIGGSINNQWTFYTSPNILVQKTSIFDRWGNLVFVSEEGIPIWDGTINGTPCEQGVYVYLIEYLDSYDLYQVEAGDVTLLR